MRHSNQHSQTTAQNWAEWLILVGRAVHLGLRRGIEMKVVSAHEVRCTFSCAANRDCTAPLSIAMGKQEDRLEAILEVQ